MARYRKKLIAYTITCVILMTALLGCSMENTQEDRLKDIDFTVVGEEQQPEALRDIIAEKSAEPFQISYTLGVEMYIAIGYGEQPSGGYSISVNEFYETEDSVVIDTTLIGPGKAENVTNTPTKPYIVVKTENIADKMIEFK
ncbi:MAG: protease complex subunit PrcB family protein [Lachnospiraceae bacterium]|nr:protease complex subunit PrcB family protein [Lachnospiraceae bacterium]